MENCSRVEALTDIVEASVDIVEAPIDLPSYLINGAHTPKFLLVSKMLQDLKLTIDLSFPTASPQHASFLWVRGFIPLKALIYGIPHFPVQVKIVHSSKACIISWPVSYVSAVEPALLLQ